MNGGTNVAKEQIELTQSSKVNLDVKTLVGIVVMILSIAGVYFSLQGQIGQLQLDVIRMQDTTTMNTEFRVKWPRGELGALPDDAKQDLRIEYLQKAVADIEQDIEEMEDEIESLISERNSAREAKDWPKSDSIRDRLHSMGIEIQDTPDGTKWRRI